MIKRILNKITALLLVSLLKVIPLCNGTQMSVRDRVAYMATAAGVNPDILKRIAFKESSFRTGAKRKNKDKTTDTGLFQINSRNWDPKYRVNNKKLICENLNIRLVDDNIACAIRLVKLHMKFAKKDSNWMGRYHSKTPAKKRQYAKELNKIPAKYLK